ncbi:hypothetical protein EDC94DRAFT_661716 [Helicostylum pulchrum]|nr:hypothetical protein EDC94DRAFT_661716 [Helicostylum pulchrum]
MATTIWSSKRNNRSAPCTIFTSTTLSPRQIANKAYTLGCKKLDRDDKRSKQRYHVRERLLLCNTISKAEEVLNARTRRTNRRVMAAEDEEEHSSDEFSMKHVVNNKENHSPLRSSAKDDDEVEAEEEEKTIPHINTTTTTTTSNHIASSTSSASSASLSSILPRDCRIALTAKTNVNSPIATII